MVYKTKVLLDGLFFPEGPRWHAEKLWFSDMQDRCVMTVDAADGKSEKIIEIEGSPSGLGWLPDGRLQVVSMLDRRLLRLDPTGLVEIADLNHLASFHCNDMVMDQQGRAYIGNFGFDYAANARVKPAEIVLVTPEGHARIVAENLLFPNGTVITPDGQTLIVAETFGNRLTAFDIEPDGSLKNRRVWAALEGVFPDVICLDAEGAIWVAAPHPGEVLRALEGGTISHRATVSTRPYACMLGGNDRCTLFVCTAGSAIPEEVRVRPGGKIETIDVDVPGAGLP
ncbi:MAG: SMP-30/gluconolactonase/LRE family protein [Desulfobacteraceae bacterium]|jgi:sugar lactone lactonase YvrE|nr:SMP-30/gluconolactonase/LRE family protein [Desulfobacteraceae bacterium]